MSDPWEHRSQNLKCATCMWCAPKKDAKGKESELGRCRRRCPTMSGYPVIFMESDWCGDHKLDENSL